MQDLARRLPMEVSAEVVVTAMVYFRRFYLRCATWPPACHRHAQAHTAERGAAADGRDVRVCGSEGVRVRATADAPPVPSPRSTCACHVVIYP